MGSRARRAAKNGTQENLSGEQRIPSLTRVTLVCKECGYSARRDLMHTAAVWGVHNSISEPGLCPKGHGPLSRKDENEPGWRAVGIVPEREQ